MKKFLKTPKDFDIISVYEVDIESRMTLNKYVAPRLNDTICKMTTRGLAGKLLSDLPFCFIEKNLQFEFEIVLCHASKWYLF